MYQSLGPRLRKQMGSALVLAACLIFLSACASTPVAPPSSLSEARDAIDRAEQSDARQHAGAELDQANRKMALAERALSEERLGDAEQLGHQSRITAELAMARTEAAKAEAINRQMQRDADALSEELKRKGEQQ